MKNLNSKNKNKFKYMIEHNNIDKCILMLRELQTMLFDESVDNKAIFSKTLEINDSFNKFSVEYNKYLNEKMKYEKNQI